MCTFNGAILLGARLFSGTNVRLLKFITLHTKLVPVDVMKVYGMEVQLHLFLSSAVDEGDGQLYDSAAPPLRRNPDTH